MTEEELKERRVQIQAAREHILGYVTHANREEVAKSIDNLSTLVAMTATDIAIKATSDSFIAKIKEAAEQGSAIAEGKPSGTN